MTYPPHALVQFGGTLTPLTGQSEIWTCGVRVTKAVVGGGGGFLDDPQGYANSLVTPLKTWFASAADLANDATLTWVKVNNINAAGKYNDPVTHRADIPPQVGSGIPKAPQFCCIALTLETGFLRGPAHRGRIYLPNYVYSFTGSQTSAANVALVLAAGKRLMQTLQTPGGGATPASTPVVVSKLGSGAVRPITGLSVDNIYDYISRRKDRLTSTRTSGPAY